ncbi:hypothetical protein Anapl_02822 [Anas platyrhynchos]|uniref:Uncharacterized protein n=1 Tax=Anas platyrhynchos TaxID=8839 RepID=R0LHT4_ANAPL|nr:hypothetical protein Anapl_02822 [Anas platyrhynchos]
MCNKALLQDGTLPTEISQVGCYEQTQGLSAACHHVTLNALPLLLGCTKYQQEQKLSEVRVNLLLLLMMLLDHLPVLLLNMANEKAHKRCQEDSTNQDEGHFLGIVQIVTERKSVPEDSFYPISALQLVNMYATGRVGCEGEPWSASEDVLLISVHQSIVVTINAALGI